MASKILNLQLSVLSAISGIIDKALDLEQSLQDILRILSETLSMNAFLRVCNRGENSGPFLLW